MKIKYSEKIVVFIDVLGFSNIVFSKDKIKVQEYFSYIQERFHFHLSERKFTYVVISDSLVVTTEKNKESLKELIFIMGKIQYELFLKGVLVRGAISFGELYINKSKNIIVGQGLINAYKLENTAKFPRIIIDRRIIPEFFSSTSDFLNYLNKIDEFKITFEFEPYSRILFDNLNIDGKPYINFVRMIVRYSPTYQAKSLENIYALFLENYYKNEYFDKYNWLLQEFIRELDLALIHYNNRTDMGTPFNKNRKIESIKNLKEFFHNL